MKEKLKTWLKKGGTIVLSIAILLFLIEFLGAKYGILGWLGMCVGLALWRIAKRWKNFVMILEYAETFLFGKPLRRELWKKGEFKNRKRRIKLKWKMSLDERLRWHRNMKNVISIFVTLCFVYGLIKLYTIAFIFGFMFLLLQMQVQTKIETFLIMKQLEVLKDGERQKD